MLDDYFYKEKGAEIGPISWDNLKWLADSGRLDRNALVRQGRTGKWLLAKRIKGLIDLSAKPITPPKEPPASQEPQPAAPAKSNTPTAPPDSLPAHLLPQAIAQPTPPTPPPSQTSPPTNPQPKKIKRVVPIDDLLPPSTIPKSPPKG